MTSRDDNELQAKGSPVPENDPALADEYVPEDDSVIGRVFRWSLLAIIAIGLCVAGVLYVKSLPEKKVEVDEKPIVLPRAQKQTATAPAVRFVDITREAGIDFVHEDGARGKKFLPETMGGGCAFLDHDGDGDQDVLFVNSMPWPEDRRAGEPLPTHRLYANDGEGRFEDVTGATGLAVSAIGMGAAAADYDNDGDPDLLITAVGRNRFFRNDGGKFVDVTEEVGLSGADDAWSTSAAFFDADRDGDLDLFVCNYIRWSREIDLKVNSTLTGGSRAYGPPIDFEGAHSYLYRNDDGKFVDISKQAGIEVENPATGQPLGKALAVVPVDLDADGWLDLMVANDTVQNFLFHNQANGTFTEIGEEAGVAFDSNGMSTGAMGVDAAYFRNDDSLAIGIGNFSNEMSSLYVSQGIPLLYADEAITQGIGPQSRTALTFGLFFFDYDLDGRLDMLQANGHLEEEINVVQPSQHYRQPAQLFWNAGPESPHSFVLAEPESTGDLAQPIVGRGAAFADIDGDGDLDVLLTQVGDRPLLLRNDQALGHHFVRLRLRGRQANRDGIGAAIELTAGGTTQRKLVMPGRSYLSQVELPVTFGLGEATAVSSVEILWPDGSRQTVDPAHLQLDRESTIEQSPSRGQGG